MVIVFIYASTVFVFSARLFGHKVYLRNLRTDFLRTTFREVSMREQKLKTGLDVVVTICCHGDDGFGCGMVLVLHPRVVLIQQLRERRRFGQQLADHVPADVGRLLEPEDAEDLGLDAVEPHLPAVLPELTGGALLPALRQQPGGLVHLRRKARREEDGQTEQEQHLGGKRSSDLTPG